MKIISTILLIFCSSVLWSQDDSTGVKTFNEVQIIRPVIPEEPQRFTTEDIERLQPLDLGSMLQSIPSVSIKNYGDVGGLKTLSYRGMGAQHNVLMVNGFAVANAQTGMADYSQVPVENVSYIEHDVFGRSNILPTVGAALQGNVVSILTKGRQLNYTKQSVLASYGISSFGQHDIFALYKRKLKKGAFGIDVNQRFYRGNYTYNFQTSGIDVEGVRENNAYQSSFVNFNYIRNWEKNYVYKVFEVFGGYTNIANELPGAVLLYAIANDEELNSEKGYVNLSYKSYNKRVKAWNIRSRSYASFQLDKNQYLDPTYFNAAGFLEHNYQNFSHYYGHYAKALKGDRFTLNWGGEFENNLLNSNREDFATPNRLMAKGLMAGEVKYTKYIVKGSLGGRYILEQNRGNNTWRNPIFAFTPEVLVDRPFLIGNVGAFLWYQRSFRLPNFNELYYSQIGNIALDPEKVNQLNLGVKWHSKNSVGNAYGQEFNANAFGNLIEDKILAIPTKNLFIWSMQNVGQVGSIGGDVSYVYRKKFRNNKFMQLNANYTYQRVVDLSEKGSATYRHQIAYIPEHSANFSGTFEYRNFGMTHSLNYIGARYALNQNIPQNKVAAYMTYDINLSLDLRGNSKLPLRVNGGIKNVGGKNYQYVKSFVLQGRSFYLKLIYEI
ncbi:Outer membrane cobalamin receptor protein [Lishizhenia tianjinensis]|uniref:Outer membrane cobalamin receptor protein n=1 Tax=Lishizhenia tianjinensis TaxID=477690 RepID=A0A1I6YYA0_9FLAO|nr:TonB-dependent receptor plug domain-containing protein [Lishizhenia tianjinensis]SFT55473.1 Outer membrane cobalamin receptor protein [Lishizhenia tianjinensis]